MGVIKREKLFDLQTQERAVEILETLAWGRPRYFLRAGERVPPYIGREDFGCVEEVPQEVLHYLTVRRYVVRVTEKDFRLTEKGWEKAREAE